MSPPRLPLLPCRAPPIVPGMPTRGSSPARPARTVSLMAWASFTPPPAVTCGPGHANLRERRTGEADHDARDALVADQHIGSAAQEPNRHILVAAAASNEAASSSTELGSAKNSAGPPSLSHVRCASGSCSLTIFRSRCQPASMATKFPWTSKHYRQTCWPPIVNSGGPFLRNFSPRSGRAALTTAGALCALNAPPGAYCHLANNFVSCHGDAVRQIEAANLGLRRYPQLLGRVPL